VIVGAPGSTQPSLTPPTAAELLAEQADRAATFTTTGGWFGKPSTWILRDVATPSGNQPVWATADDSEQASYVNGQLVVCARSAPCASSTTWLMPAGPSYAPSLPETLPELLAALNAYSTGCTDVAGDCNAVNAVANIIAGYENRDSDGNWFLMLADIPGVTVKQVTDVTGQRDLALQFPFNDGVTEILFNASTYQFAGYVRGGVETVITDEGAVTGPGSYTPLVIPPPKSAPLPPAGH